MMQYESKTMQNERAKVNRHDLFYDQEIINKISKSTDNLTGNPSFI